MKKINVAVIGLGYWGPNLVRNLLNIPQVSQVYGCEIKKERLQALKKDFPNVSMAQHYSLILNNSAIDAVIIATPIKTHFKLAKKAIQAKKHVLIEKPMTATSDEAGMLIKLAKKQRKLLMVGHTFVYSETIKKIKQFITHNELGKIYYYDSTRINLGIIQKDASVIWDLAPHDLSIITHLFPERPISIQAFGSAFIGNQYEVAHIFLQLENNISTHIHVSWLSPVKIRSILIGGSKKMIVYNDIEPTEKIKLYDKGVIPSPLSVTPFSPAYRSGDIIIPHLEQKEALSTELIHFIECIAANKEPLTDGQEGLKVVTLLEKIEQALITHREIIL